MPRCWRYERLMPRELAQALKTRPIAYLGVGPLEWHGEHLAFGTDPMRANLVMEGVWKKHGGVLLPTLFVGTDNFKTYAGKKHWGMEMFARTSLPGSLYVREETFKALISDTLDFLQRQGFKLTVLFTGHEARNQTGTLGSLEKAWGRKPMKVSAWWAGKFRHPDELKRAGGHAGEDETSEMMNVDPRLVARGRAGRLARDLSVSLGAGIRKVTPARGRARQDFQIKAIGAEIRRLLP